jgi:sulfur-oxidizing protein SoxB
MPVSCLAPPGWEPTPPRAGAAEADAGRSAFKFDSKGQVTLLHFTDCHAQLKPVYFRPPDTNIGVGAYAGVPPHLVAQEFLDYFNIERGSPYAYAHTMVDYVDLARTYGKLGGLDRTATLVKAIRADRGDDKVLFLDGGDTWQGSYTSLKTNGMDMVECMKLLKPDAMTGHWEFTFGEDRVSNWSRPGLPVPGVQHLDAEWDEPAFEPTRFRQGRRARRRHRPGVALHADRQSALDVPELVVRHPRGSVIRRMSMRRAPRAPMSSCCCRTTASTSTASWLRASTGIDVILTGHTHDALPEPEVVNDTGDRVGLERQVLSRVDLDVKRRQGAGLQATS